MSMLNFSLLGYKLVSLFMKHYYKIKGSKNCSNNTALNFAYNDINSNSNHMILGVMSVDKALKIRSPEGVQLH